MVLLRSTETRKAEKKISESRERIISTLEMSGLNKEQTLVLGGSALALAGIRPARDVDLMVPHASFTSLARHEQTPGGFVLRPKPDTTHAFLTTPEKLLPPSALSLDITHPHGPDNRPSPELDEELLKRMEEFGSVEGYHFLPPELVAAHKKTTGRRKDRRDIKLIEKVARERNE